MEITSPSIRVGPSGWDHPDWSGVVFPTGKSRKYHPLELLACYFDTVEISSTFLGAVRPEISRLWLAKVSNNQNFRFTARLGRRFTHERVLAPSEVGTFKDGLWPLLQAGRFGQLLLQFPWSFRFTQENREFLIRLRRSFHEFPMAVELRHASWMADEALGTLIDYRLGFVNVDQPPYARAMPPTSFVTAPPGSIRLHGRNPGYWRDEFEAGDSAGKSGDYLYSPSELKEWKARIEHVAAHAAATYVITANSRGGRSVVNALQLQSLLGAARRDAPASLLTRYRQELAGYRPSHAGQRRLFEGNAGRAA